MELNFILQKKEAKYISLWNTDLNHYENRYSSELYLNKINIYIVLKIINLKIIFILINSLFLFYYNYFYKN